MAKRNCLLCDKKFSQNCNHQKFCSAKCRAGFRRTAQERNRVNKNWADGMARSLKSTIEFRENHQDEWSVPSYG